MRRTLLLLACLCPLAAHGADAPRRTALTLRPDDVIATGNEWLALPDIRAADGALGTFNALSMRDRGLLQASGEAARPVLEPYFLANGKRLDVHNLSWELLEEPGSPRRTRASTVWTLRSPTVHRTATAPPSSG